MNARIAGWLKDLTSLSSVPGALVKTLLGIALLIAHNEVPNAGKTIIQPFSIYVSSAQTDLGSSISDRLLNAFGSLNEELKPDVIRLLPPGEKNDLKFRFVTANGIAGRVDAALAKSSDLKLGDVQIPFGFLVAPIQLPMRALLGVRLITGSLQTDRDGYILLASSTAGETWKVSWSAKDPLLAGTPIPPEAVASLVDNLAFKISRTSPTLAAVMPNSWDAFVVFKEGMKEWK